MFAPNTRHEESSTPVQESRTCCRKYQLATMVATRDDLGSHEDYVLLVTRAKKTIKRSLNPD